MNGRAPGGSDKKVTMPTEEAEGRLVDALVLATQSPDDARADRAAELAKDIAAMLEPAAVQRAMAAAAAICGGPRHG